MTVADYPDFTTPQAHATAIAATGAPLLQLRNTPASGTTVAIAPGNSVTIGPFTMTQPGYDLRILVTASAAPVTCMLEVQLAWQEAGPVNIASKRFAVVGSTGGHLLGLSGPVRASSLSVTFTNIVGAPNITVAYTLVQQSRLPGNDLCRTLFGSGAGAPSTYNWLGQQVDQGVLANSAASVNAGASRLLGLGMHNGPLELQAHTASLTNDLEVQVNALDTVTFSGYGVLYDNFTDSHGNLNAQFQVPNTQCFVTLINHNAAAQVCSLCAVVQETNVN